jgi:cytochrome c553
MKKLLVLFVAVAMVSLAAISAMADNVPAEVKLPAKMGEVTFNHTAHQERTADCTTCHHKGVEAGACRSCHGVDENAPKAKDAFHKVCKDCHKANNGPTSCKGCHVK